MSETPRTDACEVLCDCGANYVDSDVARNFERALTAERAARERAEAERDALLARICDDALAMTCQSIGQYRTALMAAAGITIRAAKDAATGILHEGCNYLAPVGHVCNKCGQIVRAAKEGS